MNENVKPTNKVAAGGIAGALTIIIVFIADATGVEMPPAVASAVTTLVTAVTAWFVPNK